MLNTSITNFRKNIFSFLKQTITFNEPLNISTKDGNAVVISEDDYKDIMATLEIYENEELHQDLLKARKSPNDDFVSEDEVNW